MAITVTYNKVGKGIAVDGVTKQTFYGVDFNPTEFNRPSGWSSVTATNVSTSFDLTDFQPGHEVACGVVQLKYTSSYSGDGWADFERYDGSSWTYDFYIWEDFTASSGQSLGLYIYFGVDVDEIWNGYTKYRVHYYSTDGVIDFYSPEFTVSNLSIDSSWHRAGYFWVEGRHLCYIDGTSGLNFGYKHKIAYDSGYATPSAGEPGYVWLESGDNLSIYYIDEYGTKRRTYTSDSRFGGNVNVGSDNRGFIWASSGGEASDGYGYLCFIAPNGSKRRILNGPPIGYS